MKVMRWTDRFSSSTQIAPSIVHMFLRCRDRKLENRCGTVDKPTVLAAMVIVQDQYEDKLVLVSMMMDVSVI